MATTSTTKKILTIDDEQSIVDLIVDILETNNYTAISATKWTDALDALNHEKPDLILLDLNMPTIHGTSMIDFIVSEEFNIPVIVVSGFVTEQVSAELRRQGVKGIVKKPFKARVLLDEIEKHLKNDELPAAPAANAMDALYNRPATSLSQPSQASKTPSMDALYGASETGENGTPKTNLPPANDILEALKRNAAKSVPATTQAPPQPSDLLDALKKQTAKANPQPPPRPKQETTQAAPPKPEITQAAPAELEAPPLHQMAGGAPPMSRPIDNLITSLPPTAQTGPDFGVREHSARRRPRKKMDKGNMMFFGGITVVCVLVAGFLAVMQWVASEAPVAMEQFKADLENGVNAQMQGQMNQMKQQMQQQTIQQQLKAAKSK